MRGVVANVQCATETYAKIDQHKAALLAKLTELEAAAGRLDGIAVETSPDAMDDSAFANERDLAVGRLVSVTSLLAAVRAALDRIADGSYGECLECGETISAKRLAALPWAAYCRTCQETRDSRNVGDAASPAQGP